MVAILGLADGRTERYLGFRGAAHVGLHTIVEEPLRQTRHRDLDHILTGRINPQVLDRIALGESCLENRDTCRIGESDLQDPTALPIRRASAMIGSSDRSEYQRSRASQGCNTSKTYTFLSPRKTHPGKFPDPWRRFGTGVWETVHQVLQRDRALELNTLR